MNGGKIKPAQVGGVGWWDHGWPLAEGVPVCLAGPAADGSACGQRAETDRPGRAPVLRHRGRASRPVCEACLRAVMAAGEEVQALREQVSHLLVALTDAQGAVAVERATDERRREAELARDAALARVAAAEREVRGLRALLDARVPPGARMSSASAEMLMRAQRDAVLWRRRAVEAGWVGEVTRA